MPERIQLSRKRGSKMPVGTVKVDRATKWGNPFVPLEGGFFADMRRKFSLWAQSGTTDVFGADAFAAYEQAAPLNSALVATARSELRGKNLACWCRPADPDRCHAAVLLKIANSDEVTHD